MGPWQGPGERQDGSWQRDPWLHLGSFRKKSMQGSVGLPYHTSTFLKLTKPIFLPARPIHLQFGQRLEYRDYGQRELFGMKE